MEDNVSKTQKKFGKYEQFHNIGEVSGKKYLTSIVIKILNKKEKKYLVIPLMITPDDLTSLVLKLNILEVKPIEEFINKCKKYQIFEEIYVSDHEASKKEIRDKYTNNFSK